MFTPPCNVCGGPVQRVVRDLNVFQCGVCHTYYKLWGGVLTPGVGYIEPPEESLRQKAYPFIEDPDFEEFLRQTARGAKRRGEPGVFPTTLEEYYALPEDTKSAYRTAYRLSRGK